MAKSKDSKKKNDIKLNISESEDSKQISKIIKYFVIVVVIVIAVYFLTVYITKNSSDSDYKTKVGEATIQDSKILAGTTFNQNDSEYYVLFYDTTSSDSEKYATLYSNYKEKEKHTAIYYVDLHEGLNKKYISDDVNATPGEANDIRVNGPTLMKIKDKKLDVFTTNTDEITNKLS